MIERHQLKTTPGDLKWDESPSARKVPASCPQPEATLAGEGGDDRVRGRDGEDAIVRAGAGCGGRRLMRSAIRLRWEARLVPPTRGRRSSACAGSSDVEPVFQPQPLADSRPGAAQSWPSSYLSWYEPNADLTLIARRC